ncbi:MAG: hypothetical protein AAB217_01915, partial [Chloroflexota bacterium]
MDIRTPPPPQGSRESDRHRGALRGGAPPRLSALIALQLLAGHAQSSFYTLLLAAAWLALHSLNNADRWRTLVVNGLKFGLAVLFAFCLTAVQLIPTYELLRQSPRAAAAEHEFVVTYSLWPWRILTFAAPNLFGHPADHNYVGYATYWEDDGYLGMLPLMFAAYAVYCVFRIPFLRPTQYALRNTSLFLLLAITISIILALGKNTPIFPFFYRFVPGFDLFQAPARMLVWYTFAVSLLAGVGADQWQASARKRYWARLGIAGSVGMLMLGLAGTLATTNENTLIVARGVIGAAAVALGTFVLILAQPLASNRWRWLTLAFITLDLGLAAVRLNPTIDSAFYRLQPAFTLNEGRVLTRSVPKGRIFQFADDEYQVKFDEFFRLQSFDAIDPQSLRNSLLPNLSALSGMASANNFEPLRPERYVRYLEMMENSPRLLNLADVRAIVKPDGVVLLRAEDTARLRVVYHVQTVANGAAALAAITNP